MLNELIEGINLEGLAIGLATFLIIGVFHPLVIKGEYYMGQKCNWLFAGAGIIFLIFSLKLSGVASILCGVTAFSCFWSILEGHSGKFVYSPSGITVYEYRVNKRSVFMLPE